MIFRGKHFRMEVKDLFKLADGRTVFLGQIKSNYDPIKKVRCRLMLDGRPVQDLTIEGEMIPKKTSFVGKSDRSVSTTDSVSLSSSDIQCRKCSLETV